MPVQNKKRFQTDAYKVFYGDLENVYIFILEQRVVYFILQCIASTLSEL